MGLMYLFPTDENDKNDDRIQIKDETIILKTYGLPMIFWGYLAAILIVVGAMALVSHNIIEKMLTYNDATLTALAYLVRSILFGGPIILVGFYFYEKFLIKKDNQLQIVHRVFYIPFYSKKIILDKKDDFVVEHYLESPNVAKKLNKEELRGFENKGYFELKAIIQNQKVSIDRSSRKADLLKIKDLLSKY
jgi:hypothetical protein